MTTKSVALTLSNSMEFMSVTAGKFLMGSAKENKLAFKDERPQHTVDILYDYWMARFPVTNELYSAYAEVKGIKHPVSGWEKKKEHPVVYIKGTDTIEYFHWLNNLLKDEIPSGLVLRLPTEAEWEKAARWRPFPFGSGDEGESLEYPWGNEFDKNKCNSSEGGKNDTTPVGLYSPQGDSPDACADMAGNVWEWTHSLYKDYPYRASDGRKDEKDSDRHVFRGGSTYDKYDRCAGRLINIFNINRNVGFRVALGPPLLQ